MKVMLNYYNRSHLLHILFEKLHILYSEKKRYLHATYKTKYRSEHYNFFVEFHEKYEHTLRIYISILIR